MTWEVYYEDGTSYTSEPLPKLGAAVVGQLKADGSPHIIHGKDFYILKRGEWIGADDFGLIDHVLHKLDEIDMVIAGRSQTNMDFDRIFKKAKGDWMNGRKKKADPSP